MKAGFHAAWRRPSGNVYLIAENEKGWHWLHSDYADSAKTFDSRADAEEAIECLHNCGSDRVGEPTIEGADAVRARDLGRYLDLKVGGQ